MSQPSPQRRKPLGSVIDDYLAELKALAEKYPLGHCPASLRTLLLLDIWLSPDERTFTEHLTSLYRQACRYTDVDGLSLKHLEQVYGCSFAARDRLQKLCAASSQETAKYSRDRYLNVEGMLRFTERGQHKLSREQVWYDYLKSFRPEWMFMLTDYVEPGAILSPDDAIVIGGAEMDPRIYLVVRLPALYYWLQYQIDQAGDRARIRPKGRTDQVDIEAGLKALVAGAKQCHSIHPSEVWGQIRKTRR